MYTYPEKRKILVVEDEADIRQVLCFFLKHSGFEVRGAANGLEAIRAIPEFAPDLIVLDILMRPVNGWDVLHWLRDHHAKPLPPVLVLTALAHTSEQMHGFEEGAVEYLTKPTQPSTIVERVNVLLSLSAEQRSMLQRKRLDEHRRTMERLYAAQPDELVY
jgi:DNA-binding response OmpR family regulator